MPEVQNVGTVDYSQYQPSEYPQYDNYVEDYNMQPQVYDEEAAEVRSASKSRLGATLLTAAIIGGGALWGGYALGKKGAKKELTELQNAADKYKDFIDKQAKDLEKQADEVINANIFSWKKGGKFAEKVKEELKKLREALASLKDDAADEGKNVADGAK